MADTITFRPNDQDRKTLAKIRKNLVETFAAVGKEPTETDAIRFALREAEKLLQRSKH
jgi:hypothetical protein